MSPRICYHGELSVAPPPIQIIVEQKKLVEQNLDLLNKQQNLVEQTPYLLNKTYICWTKSCVLLNKNLNNTRFCWTKMDPEQNLVEQVVEQNCVCWTKSVLLNKTQFCWTKHKPLLNKTGFCWTKSSFVEQESIAFLEYSEHSAVRNTISVSSKAPAAAAALPAARLGAPGSRRPGARAHFPSQGRPARDTYLLLSAGPAGQETENHASRDDFHAEIKISQHDTPMIFISNPWD